MSMRVGIAIGILLAVTGSLHSEQLQTHGPAPAKVYSVCEVLEQLKALNGTTVAVRGVIVGGGHGSFLSGSCTSHITTKEFVWPNDIWLTNPRTSKGLVDADPEARKWVRKAIKRLHFHQGDQVVLTYEGVLETRDLGEVVDLRSNGQVVSFGFGPGQDAPAQLIVKTVMDPSVLHIKK